LIFNFISTNTGWGGSETLWSGAADEAITRGHEVAIYLHENLQGIAAIQSLERRGAEIRWWHTRRPAPTFSARFRRRLFGTEIPFANWWQENFNPNGDLICINQGTWEEALRFPEIPTAVKKSGMPYICLGRSDSARGGLNDELRDIGREFYEGAVAYVAASVSTLDLARVSLPCDLNNGIVLHSPIRDFSPEIGDYPEMGTIHFACVGRLQCSNKGQHILLKCLSSEIWRKRDWKLTFYGDGPDRNYLGDLIRFFGLEKKVLFGGHSDSMGDVYKKCHILLQPSIIEGAPQSILEGMLCRRSVIASSVSGIPEWIEDGKTGFLAAAPTENLLLEALERAWINREHWREMGEAARLSFLQKREPDPIGKLCEILEKTAKK
jgi:glycosyltransferase involved in cell wall biosynthesis